MKVYGDNAVVEEYGKPHPNATDIEGVVIIGYDPATNKWLALKWTLKNTIWLAGGGKENQETYEQTAIRELKEETGYSKFSEIIQLGSPIISHYYNEKKSTYRHSNSMAFLFLLDSKDRGDQKLEEHEKFDITWLEYNVLRNEITKTGGGVDHWLAVLSRAQNYVTENIYLKN